MKHSRCSISIFFYSLWIILSVVQASFTELFHDEAYYWLYSNKLDWGYFDHPPAIALFIKLGYLFFQNELGVRLFIILLNTGTIFLIEKILQPKNLKLFYAIIASVVLIHYGSVLAVPDIPLLFFTASFLYLYKRYTLQPNWWLMALLGINAGLLLLSKYHGILVILLTIFSNPKMLKKASTWFGILLAFVVFLPHFVWQHTRAYPTINYHLYGREASPFDYTYVLEFIFTQPLIYGPIIGFVLLYFAFKKKPETDFERALKFIFIGVFSLFFLFTFKGKVEAHWTDITFVSIIYFGYSGIEKSEKLRKFTFISLPVSLFLILAVRLFLMVDFLPKSIPVKTEFHGWKDWATQIKSVAGNRPVVFANSYQNAAKYNFYSGITSISLNDEKGRMNQFNTWESEKELQGKKVLFLPNFYQKGIDSLQTSIGPFYYVMVDDFQTYPEVKILTDQTPVNTMAGKPFEVRIEFDKNSTIESDSGVYLNAVFFNIHNQLLNYRTELKVTQKLIDEEPVQFIKVYPPGKGEFALYFTLSNDWFFPTVHSYHTKVYVE
jgi:4-amino-4-deoxy-L-arabinose transferase-like glycosyltransferase